jgi:hypothetical protein
MEVSRAAGPTVPAIPAAHEERDGSAHERGGEKLRSGDHADARAHDER